jgi:hypothetical protein
MRHCPNCGSEFQDWVVKCLDCGFNLNDTTARTKHDEEAESETDQLQALEVDDGEATVEDFVDEIIADEDFVDPDALDDYGEKVEISPRANLVSVVQSPSTEEIKRAALALRTAGIKIYLLKKAGVFKHFYVMMVESADSEKAEQILKETDNGSLVPIDPAAEDPELKDAPVINLDEEEQNKPALNPVSEEDEKMTCPGCQSADLEVKSSLFSTQLKLKCRDCGYQWKVKG